MRKNIIAGMLITFLMSVTYAHAQQADSLKMAKEQYDNSVTVSKAQKRIDGNLKDANKAQRKIDKKQKRIDKQERRIKRQENKREKRMDRIENDQDKIKKASDQ